jgi:hypothetical protein
MPQSRLEMILLLRQEQEAVLRTHDILVWIRILLFSSLTFKMPTKNKFFVKNFFAYYFLKVHLHHFPKIKGQKVLQNSKILHDDRTIRIRTSD